MAKADAGPVVINPSGSVGEVTFAQVRGKTVLKKRAGGGSRSGGAAAAARLRFGIASQFSRGLEGPALRAVQQASEGGAVDAKAWLVKVVMAHFYGRDLPRSHNWGLVPRAVNFEFSEDENLIFVTWKSSNDQRPPAWFVSWRLYRPDGEPLTSAHGVQQGSDESTAIARVSGNLVLVIAVMACDSVGHDIQVVGDIGVGDSTFQGIDVEVHPYGQGQLFSPGLGRERPVWWRRFLPVAGRLAD